MARPPHAGPLRPWGPSNLRPAATCLGQLTLRQLIPSLRIAGPAPIAALGSMLACEALLPAQALPGPSWDGAPTCAIERALLGGKPASDACLAALTLTAGQEVMLFTPAAVAHLSTLPAPTRARVSRAALAALHSVLSDTRPARWVRHLPSACVRTFDPCLRPLRLPGIQGQGPLPPDLSPEGGLGQWTPVGGLIASDGSYCADTGRGGCAVAFRPYQVGPPVIVVSASFDGVQGSGTAECAGVVLALRGAAPSATLHLLCDHARLVAELSRWCADPVGYTVPVEHELGSWLHRITLLLSARPPGSFSVQHVSSKGGHAKQSVIDRVLLLQPAQNLPGCFTVTEPAVGYLAAAVKLPGTEILLACADLGAKRVSRPQQGFAPRAHLGPAHVAGRTGYAVFACASGALVDGSVKSAVYDAVVADRAGG